MPKRVSKVLTLRSKIEKTNLKSKKLNRLKGLKMLAVMATTQPGSSDNTSVDSDQPSNGNSKDFLSTGRTGRRNALPDVFGENALVTSSDLPDKFKKLATSDNLQDSSKESDNLNSNNKTTPSTSK
ncbi:uncharacterized protein LOC108741320 isoform X1 [Agrilus planipennis]|uniref:Uncharacterized protein LOC108741320 isoform X1 n=1 Tax=Agrilus planipennis TaxID=224129 RepID=A0A1W4X693_AGRPL|nr:uncharacterized protein LOC108741320 isoform X1 [Agrilus planipennis]